MYSDRSLPTLRRIPLPSSFMNVKAVDLYETSVTFIHNSRRHGVSLSWRYCPIGSKTTPLFVPDS
jgi:hypothetical protein